MISACSVRGPSRERLIQWNAGCASAAVVSGRLRLMVQGLR